MDHVVIKPVKGMLGYYVSSSGKIYSRWRRRGTLGRRGSEKYLSASMKELKPIKRGKYLAVTLYSNDERVMYSIHRLVLDTFVGPCPEDMEACHYNGNKYDNRLENLYWGTHQQNGRDAVRMSEMVFGEKHKNAKLTEEQVKEIMRLLRRKVPQRKIAKRFGMSQSTISYISQGVIWRRTTSEETN